MHATSPPPTAVGPTGPGLYDTDLERNPANFTPLTPLRFLDRAAAVHPDRLAVIDGERRFTWAEHAERCRRLARALIASGIEGGDTVSILAPNTAEMLEAQFGVPLAGAVLNSINIRLDAAAIGFILAHSETRLLLVDPSLADVAREALLTVEAPIAVVDLGPGYAPWLARGRPDTELRYPRDEWDAIALNYTSGTTGNPKGVVYHHRAAFLNAVGTVVYAGLNVGSPVYLWTLPLFHCNGWCHAWALAAVGGTSVCLHKVVAADVYAAIEQHGVTYFCGAPAVLAALVNERPADWTPPTEPILVACAGASPPVSVIRETEALGFRVLHVYGMTEQHGVITVCTPQPGWDALSEDERLRHLGRQGVPTVVADRMMVADPATLAPVPADGATLGEVMFRGNLAMKGYLKNAAATREAFANDWHHTGDLAVVHPNGYIEIKDRSKDIIISGGENVSSIEVEEVLLTHPAILGAAVVAVPDPRWGEVPCAVVELKPGIAAPTAEAVIGWCRARLPGFKTPKHVIFEPIQRTATGKLQKFRLRDHAAAVIAARSG